MGQCPRKALPKFLARSLRVGLHIALGRITLEEATGMNASVSFPRGYTLFQDAGNASEPLPSSSARLYYLSRWSLWSVRPKALGAPWRQSIVRPMIGSMPVYHLEHSRSHLSVPRRVRFSPHVKEEC